jgi:hypothetical protein
MIKKYFIKENENLFKLLILIFVLFLSFILCEMLLRVYIVFKYNKLIENYNKFGHIREPLLGFELQPNIKNKYLDGLNTRYSTNSRGFRGNRENTM